MQIAKDPVRGLLRISGSLHVSEAEKLCHGLRDQLAEGQELLLDLSEVDACDTACLQLFYAARNSALRQQKPFRVTALSSAVSDTGKVLGMPLELLTSSNNPSPGSEGERGQDGTQ
jgi:anti-anti-sigma regulatory factor